MPFHSISLVPAGVRVLINPPAEVPPDYTLFMAQSLEDIYEIPCEDSIKPGHCTLHGSQQVGHSAAATAQQAAAREGACFGVRVCGGVLRRGGRLGQRSQASNNS